MVLLEKVNSKQQKFFKKKFKNLNEEFIFFEMDLIWDYRNKCSIRINQLKKLDRNIKLINRNFKFLLII